MSRRSILKLAAGMAPTTAGGTPLSNCGASSAVSAAALAVVGGQKLTIWRGAWFLKALDTKFGSLFQE